MVNENDLLSGRTSDYTFYVSFDLEDHEYTAELGDQRSTEYNKLTNGLKKAVCVFVLFLFGFKNFYI